MVQEQQTIKETENFVKNYEKHVNEIALAALHAVVSTPNAKSVKFTITLSIDDTQQANLHLESFIDVVKPE